MDCGPLTNPTDGQVNHNTGTTFGETAIYSCALGYDLIGESTRICQANGITGEWSGVAPSCECKF